MKCNKEITVRMVLIGKYCGKKGNAFKYAVYPKENECVINKMNIHGIVQLMKAKEGKVCVDGVMWYYMCVDEFYVVCVVDGDVGDNGSVVGELLRKYWDMWKKGKGEVNVSEKRMKELYGKCKEIKCNISSSISGGMNNMCLECSAYDEHEQSQQQQQQHTMMLSKQQQQDALTILSNDNEHTSSSSLSSLQLPSSPSSYITTIIKVNKLKTIFIVLCFTFIISIYSSLPFLIRTIM